MKKLFILGLMGLIAALAGPAGAATFSFNGNIAMHYDVIHIPFTLDHDATDVKVWTDSFQNGVNFDPITIVWKDGVMIGENDDDDSIAPGQSYFDSGLAFSTLAAGNYLFTIATYDNFAVGTQLSQGFNFDHQAGIPLADWCQQENSCGMGAAWSAHLDGVDTALPPPVPEPSVYGMLLAGIGILALAARRSSGFVALH